MSISKHYLEVPVKFEHEECEVGDFTFESHLMRTDQPYCRSLERPEVPTFSDALSYNTTMSPLTTRLWRKTVVHYPGASFYVWERIE